MDERTNALLAALATQRNEALNQAANLAADLRVSHQRITDLEQEVSRLKPLAEPAPADEATPKHEE